MKRVFSVLTIIIATVSFSSCTRTDEKATSPTAPSASATKSGVSITYLGPDGRKQMTLYHEKANMPTNYPKDVPVYPGVKVNGNGRDDQGLGISFADIDQPVREKNGEFLLLESTDPLEKILDFYSQELERNGWKTQTVQVTDARLSGLAASKDSRRVQLLIKNSSGKRDIMQVVSP